MAYLGFEYIPQPTWELSDQIVAAAHNPLLDNSLSELIQKGMSALSQLFSQLLAPYSDEVTHVLPLSGGLDSRTILGGLLEHVDPSQIVTLTFGTPGTLDYEVGQEVASEIGVENHAIDLTPEKFPWTESQLVQSASEYSMPTKLFRSRTALDYGFNQLDAENCVYWSGFMGEALAGSHLPSTESKTWDEALSYFLGMNYSLPELTPESFDPESVLPKEPAVDRDILSYDEQLDYGIRQPYFIEPAAVFRDDFETPYHSEPWLSFVLNLPRRHRTNRSLFKKIISTKYPDLFSIRTESAFGFSIDAHPYKQTLARGAYKLQEKLEGLTRRQSPSWHTNHLDWDIELRRSDMLRDLAADQLSDLETRERLTWLSPMEFLEEHEKGSDHGQEIRQLTSLELFLKSEDRR